MNGINKRTKMLFTGVSILILSALYLLIFGFSSQDGEASGNLSMQVSRMGVELWNSVTNRHWNETAIKELVSFWEHPVRKLAHFSEYAVLGMPIAVISGCWIGKKYRRWTVTVIWIAVSAAADEFHQAFVPGRYSSLGDVLLDTCGGIFGACVCMAAIRIVLKRKKNADRSGRKCRKTNRRKDMDSSNGKP